jgi:hypothetical protein
MTTPRRLAETAADITPELMVKKTFEFTFRDSECKELTGIHHIEHVSHFYGEDGRYFQACYTADAICAKEEDEFLTFDMSSSCGGDCIETAESAAVCSPTEYQVRVYTTGYQCDFSQALGALPKKNIFEGTRDDHVEPCTCHTTADGTYVMKNYGNVEGIAEEEYNLKTYKTCEDVLEDREYLLYECPLGDVVGLGSSAHGCATFDSSKFSTGPFNKAAVVASTTVAELASAFIISSIIF